MSIQIPLCAAALSLLATSAAEAAKPHPRTPAPAVAVSAERHGTPASFHTGAVGQGYSARDRHIADCLASYRGYDPHTDKVVLPAGVTRSCPL